MEGVQTVDVSWLHHSQKDHLSRTKSASSTVNSKQNGSEEEPTTATPKPHRRSRSNSSPARPPSSGNATPKPKSEPQNEVIPEQVKEQPAPPPENPTDDKSSASALFRRGSNKSSASAQKAPAASSQTLQTPPKPVTGRRNSWISTLSSKFSSGSTPPSQSSLKSGLASPQATGPLDHNPYGAAFSPKDKEEEQKDDSNPFTSSSPKSPSFISNALRKFSSNSGGLPKLPPNSATCPRRVMNRDQDRDRCKVADLNQGKLHRVAFCVDVEIAGISHRDSDEDAPPTNQLRQSLPESNRQKARKAAAKAEVAADAKTDGQEKIKEEAGALKHPDAAVAEKESPTSATPAPISTTTPTPAAATDKNDTSPDAKAPAPTDGADAKPAEGQSQGDKHNPTRKQEKKKRSEEERKERKERKRRQAVANGSIPLQLDAEDDEDDSRPAAPGTLPTKTQSRPTTDPVRIYRRCCQLRETPVLKRVVEEISSPSSTLAESPGTVATLDLSNFPMTPQDLATLSDWLAVVPVRKLILQNCALNDASVRAILAALLSTKTVEQMRYRRRRNRKPEASSRKFDRWGVVERLSLKDNPKIGREGWHHIGLFVHLSKSLKAIDLSGIPFPNPQITGYKPSSAKINVCELFACALSERFGGDHLEELLMSDCRPTSEQVKLICEAATKMGLRRLGFANNDLTREGLEHVVEYLKDGQCEGLDLGGNPIKDDMDLIIDAIEPEQPLYALSFADCSLDPSAISPFLQALTKIHNLRFIDFSHNSDLFSLQPNALGAFRRFLPKMPSLKRIHLADVNLSPDHVIGLAEVLAECPSLCHLNILENPQIAALASATDPAAQEEACAVYASMMAAVRVSSTIVAVDIEVPTAENNEVVKALASQIVAHSLRNLEGSAAIGEDIAENSGPKDFAVPEILQHIVGSSTGTDEAFDDEEDAAPDEDYVIGGTGVVKALGVCLGNLEHHGGDGVGDSAPPSGTTTPRRPISRGVVTKRPRDMSKNLLESARNIRTRIQSALIREDRAGNDENYRRLQFLDTTLHKMIRRFEDEYPETRLPTQPVPSSVPAETGSQNSGEDTNGPIGITGNLMDNENAIDDEETDQYAIHLSRTSSMTSLHARAMTSEEGHVHRLGQNLRRDFLNPPERQVGDDEDDQSHLVALREKLERLHEQQSKSAFGNEAFVQLGNTVDELWAAQRQDIEGFEKFKQSQIAAQINSGLRPSDKMESPSPESKSPPS